MVGLWAEKSVYERAVPMAATRVAWLVGSLVDLTVARRAVQMVDETAVGLVALSVVSMAD